MQIIKKIKKYNTLLTSIKSKNKSIGFVPTMGALHEGHLSLIRRAKKENDIVVLSIFVNPKQFSANEDFDNYPRPEKVDILLAKKENVDIIIYPSAVELYRPCFLTYVETNELSNFLCGRYRKGHFRGVTTIVAKLLNIVEADKIYIGQKDAQQAIIIQRMMKDLNFKTKCIVCPTQRDRDGLALSSRNNYLSQKQRIEAPVLYRSLKNAKSLIISKEKSALKIISSIQRQIKQESSCRIQYIECVDAKTLKPLKTLNGNILIALAVYFGKTRLIDNIKVKVS